MEKKLFRNEQDKSIAGVCSGLAEYFDVDVTWVRVAFVLAVLAGFSGVLAYIILWIVVPPKPFSPDYNRYAADYRVDEDKHNSGGSPAGMPDYGNMHYPGKKKRGNGGTIIGLMFVAFGAFFLLDEFNFIPYWFAWHKLWPLVFIVPGIMMIANANKKSWKDEWKEKSGTETGADNTDKNTGS
jgi:phage shock protein C